MRQPLPYRSVKALLSGLHLLKATDAFLLPKWVTQYIVPYHRWQNILNLRLHFKKFILDTMQFTELRGFLPLLLSSILHSASLSGYPIESLTVNRSICESGKSCVPDAPVGFCVAITEKGFQAWKCCLQQWPAVLPLLQAKPPEFCLKFCLTRLQEKDYRIQRPCWKWIFLYPCYRPQSPWYLTAKCREWTVLCRIQDRAPLKTQPPLLFFPHPEYPQ